MPKNEKSMMTLRGFIKILMKRRAVNKLKKERKQVISKRNNEQFTKLEKEIAYEFENKALIRLALTHPSATNAANSRILSNQRLEFLGDAILQAIISDLVYSELSDKPEGDLTRARIAMTHGKFLSTLADSLTVPQSLILPKKLSNLRDIASSKEDALEALIGAIYLDSNFDKTKKIVLDWYEKASLDVSEMVSAQNPKGRLQEHAAKNGLEVKYRLAAQSGPDHSKVFKMEVLLNGEIMGCAEASSKKDAEVKAADIALKKLV